MKQFAKKLTTEKTICDFNISIISSAYFIQVNLKKSHTKTRNRTVSKDINHWLYNKLMLDHLRNFVQSS